MGWDRASLIEIAIIFFMTEYQLALLAFLIKKCCTGANITQPMNKTEMLLQAAYTVKKKWLNKLKRADIKIYLHTEDLRIGTTYIQ